MAAFQWLESPAEDLITGRKNPEYEIKSFLQNSDAELGNTGRKIGQFTFTIDTKNIVQFKSSPRSGKLYPKNVANQIDTAQLMDWLLELENFSGEPLTIVGAKPGDSSAIYVSPVSKEYYNTVLSPELVQVAIEKSNLPEKTKVFWDVWRNQFKENLKS